MKDLEMNKNNINSSGSPSPGDNERPSKRRRYDESDPENLENLPSPNTAMNSDDIRAEFEVLRGNLNRTEAVVLNFHEMQMETEKSIEGKKNEQDKQMRLYKEKIEELETSTGELETSRRHHETVITQLQEDLEISRRETEKEKVANTLAKDRYSKLMNVVKPIVGRWSEIELMITDLSEGVTLHKELDIIQTMTPGKLTSKQRKSLRGKGKRADEAGEGSGAGKKRSPRWLQEIVEKIRQEEILQKDPSSSEGNSRPDDEAPIPENGEDSQVLIGTKYAHKALKAKDSEMSQMISKLQIAEKKIVELEEKLEDNMISQKEFDLLSVELQQLNNQKLKIEKTALDQKKVLVARLQELEELEEELKSSKNTISTLQDAVKEMELLKQKDVEKTEMIVMLEQKNAELSSIISGYEAGGIVAAGVTVSSGDLRFMEPRTSIQTMSPGKVTSEQKKSLRGKEKRADEAGEGSGAGKKRSSTRLQERVEKLRQEEMLQNDPSSLTTAPEDHDSSLDQHADDVEEASEDNSPPDDEDPIPENGEDSQVLIGTKYAVSVDKKFLELNWDKEIACEQDGIWSCQTCDEDFYSKETVQDHVWEIHYGGIFQCPECTDPAKYYSSRKNFRGHCKIDHA